MAGTNLTYRVTGRYMTGSTVDAYHLVGEDGSQIVANKQRIIYLIGRGQIENMRTQASGDDMILRGKGINLNTLPVFDMGTGSFRNNQASRQAAATPVAPKTNSGVSPMGQLKITKRIMYKTKCLGYIVTDMSGRERKIDRNKLIELATQKLISNAIVQRYTPTDSNESKLVLKGVGCNIGALPIVSIDQNGNIIDPEKIKQNDYVYMRAVKIKRGGVIYDNEKGMKIVFASGDYILCGVNGILRPVKADQAKDKLSYVSNIDIAICDEYLDNLSKYPIELFGSDIQYIKPETVRKWPIVKVKVTHPTAA